MHEHTGWFSVPYVTLTKPCRVQNVVSCTEPIILPELLLMCAKRKNCCRQGNNLTLFMRISTFAATKSLKMKYLHSAYWQTNTGLKMDSFTDSPQQINLIQLCCLIFQFFTMSMSFCFTDTPICARFSSFSHCLQNGANIFYCSKQHAQFNL